MHRVVFCTYPSVYSDIVLDELLSAEGIELVGVVLSTRILRKQSYHLGDSLRQIRQSGFRYATYLWLVTSFYSGLRGLLRPSNRLARLSTCSLPILKTRDVNNAEGIAFLRACSANIMLSAHFNQLITQPILNQADLTCLNIHPSLLPAYKGVDPAFYALLRGERCAGATVHVQDETFDTGSILEQQAILIDRHDSLLSLNIKLFRSGAISAVRQILQLTDNANPINNTPHNSAGHYDSWPAPRDVKQFCRQRPLFRWRTLFSAIMQG